MSISGTQLDTFAQLASALGLLTSATGGPNQAWFGDPVGRAPGGTPGEPGNPNGLRHILSDDRQRNDLLAFVDGVLGAPDRSERDGATWVPLFREQDPQITIYAVVKAEGDTVRLGLAVEHATTGATPRVATRLHVPIFRLPRGQAAAPAASGGLPGWLLLGRPEGRIGVSVDLTLRDGAPPAGEASLGGLALGLDVPTAAGAAVGFALTLRELRLPGAPAPRTFTVDGSSLAALKADTFALVVGLVRAQATALDLNQPALRPFAALTGLLGLREVPGLPALPLADLTTRGLPALVDWFEGVLLDETARRKWLEQLAILLGGAESDVPTPPTKVSRTIGALTVAMGVRVAPGAGGHPVLTPWVELALGGSRAGAKMRLYADLFRADTQAGQVTAFPDLRLEAVFGQDAGGGPLLAGDPAVGSLHVGVAVTGLTTDARRPAFRLTLENVTLAGRAHPHLDLSSPEAALDAAGAVLDGALDAALALLGPAAAHIRRLLGLDAPAGITAISIPALIGDPLAELSRYWRDVSGNAIAMRSVLAAVRPLLLGVPEVAVPGAGTRADPWRVTLVGPAALHLWRDGDELVVDAALALQTPVLGPHEAAVTVALSLLRAGFTPPRATFVGTARATLALRRQDGATASLPLGDLTVEADRLALALDWAPATGLRAALDADGLALRVRGGSPVAPLEERLALALPTADATGALVLPPATWQSAERAIGLLAAQLRVPVLDAVVALLGWTGTGPRLPLAALVGADATLTPEAAVRAWLADLALDCRRLETALGPVARLLSGFTREGPLGAGSARAPFRCPVAGHRRAPGLAAWLEPGCPPRATDVTRLSALLATDEPADPATLVAELGEIGETLPDVRDLLVGRDELADGLRLLTNRWAGSDGLVVPPAALPGGVTRVDVEGYSYDELVALGSASGLVPELFPTPPAAVLHVGCEPTWAQGRPAGRAVDLSAPDAATPAPIAATGTGEWFLRLPLPGVAHAARPDRGAVGEQAARLQAFLAGRTAPIAIVAYGPAGAAALRAAHAVAAVSHVATVGTPWGAFATDALRTGRAADAVRFLERFLRPDAPAWSDAMLAFEATPLRVMRGLIGRARAIVAQEADLAPAAVAVGAMPSAGAEPRRAGLDVRAAFGVLDADQIATGMVAVLSDGLAARLDAARAAAAAPAVPHTALHVGVDLPVFELDVGGLLVGAGATLELASLRRPAAGPGLDAAGVRGVVVDLRFGVHDGWLVGGPGAAQRDFDLRWLSARVRVPLDGRPAQPGDVELVLHEARAFSTYRERWVVRADADGVAATVALPEVRLILSAAVARLRAASATLATTPGTPGPLAGLIERFGLLRDGGLDVAGLDRLLFDVQDAVDAAMADAAALAGHLRALVPGAVGTGAALTWTVDTGSAGAAGSATVTLDLAARTASVTVAAGGQYLPTLALSATLAPAGPSASVAFGALDARAGGVRLVAQAGMGVVGGASTRLEWQSPAAAGAAALAAALESIPLLPVPNPAALRRLATVALPAAVAQTLAAVLRQHASAAARPALDAALDLLGMLAPADLAGVRRVRLPIGLLDDPGAWLRHALAPWRDQPVTSAVALLDAVRPLVAPGAAPGSWPLAPEVVVRYGADAGRLRLAVEVDLAATVGSGAGAVPVATELRAGLSIGTDGSVAPVLAAGVTVAGRGVRLGIAPAVQLDLLRPAPATPLRIYPGGPGLGAALGVAAESALPPVLNALAARRGEAGSTLIGDVGAAVFVLGEAMELREGNDFTAARVATFAADPAGRLLARLPNLVQLGVTQLVTALDPGGAVVRAAGPAGGRLTLGFGGAAGAAADARPVRLVLDASTPSAPALVLRATLAVPAVGHVVIEELRLSTSGLQVQARVGPAPIAVGALTLRPLVVVSAGASAAGFTRRLGVGLALDGTAAPKSIELRWGLNDQPPALAVITRTAPGAGTLSLVESPPDESLAAVAGSLLALAASIAGTVAVDQLRAALPPQAIAALQGVVFTDVVGSTALDPQLFLDLPNGPAMFARLQKLLFNMAKGPSGPFALRIENTVTISLLAEDVIGSSPLRRRLGLSVTIDPGKKFTLASGDPTIELHVDATWITTPPPITPGLTIFVLEANATGAPNFQLVPGVTVAGLGLRFAKTSGPLLDLGAISLDAIALRVYGEATTSGAGGGVQLELGGLAIAPGGGGGSNAVANGILNDAGSAGANNRPAFSPALAVQKRPGRSLGVSLRAGPPPGPWWILVQRQLGPLYVERVGLDTRETGGTVSYVSLLFDGGVSLFGLTAQVQELSLTWLGGQFFDHTRWAVDLKGLAVSADMSGVSLAGGLLRTEVTQNGQTSVGYVGMLMGRFGVYGLSVFGGYTSVNGTPSFFVFGAVNGPIGGPPAFFLTGIGGGLGINRGLKAPDDFSKFAEYPFIQALDPAASVPDPLVKLRELTEYFPPQPGNFWFAAGISFTCFALVDGIAVVSVSFGQGLEINLMGLARMALPRPQAALVSIELGLLARFSTTEGVFLIQAQLTENSWLLYRDVRLTGGFAFATWWKGPLAGQFVLTIGGYHPDFRREGYPVVPRLGLTWKVGEYITIKGGAYFALTSEALMAGVDVEVSADFGFAWARIAFGAHGIVYFDPFWFEVMAYARISAGVKIETFLGTIRISISLGARIKVWGPDFSGEATLEIGPCEITVGFGSARTVPPRVLEWGEFIDKYLERDGDAARALSSITGKGSLQPSTGGGQSAPTPDGTAERPFEVWAEFELSLVTTIPTKRFSFGTARHFDVPVTASPGGDARLGLAPMKAGDLQSTVVLALHRLVPNAGGGVTATAIPSELARLADHVETGTDAFPIGAWGEPKPDGLPITPLPKGDVVVAGNRLRIEAVARTLERGPEMDYYRVVAGRRPLPLQAAGSARGTLLDRAADVALPAPATAAAALAAARQQLFAARSATLPDGVLARGARTNVARAAFAGDRAAPPLFGTLADGLARANGAGAGAEVKLPSAPAAPPPLRAPKVSAWLTAGAGVGKRRLTTTVKDGRIKRRAAPTFLSVQTRLSIELPVRMTVTPRPATAVTLDREKVTTVVATAAVPRTDVPGAAGSYVAGRAAGPGGFDRLVGGLQQPAKRTRGARAAEAPPRLGAGEVVVLTLPDAARDADARPQARPRLSIDGRARVTMVRGDGAVLADVEAAGLDGKPAELLVPPGTALVGVQSDGRLTVVDGLAGWHDRARVAALGSHLAVGPGCTLAIEAAQAAPRLGWMPAAEAVRDAAAVTTRFARVARTVVVVLGEGDGDRLEGFDLALRGAERARRRDGTPVPPRVVLAGPVAALVYDVRAERGAAPDAPMYVDVRVGGDRRIAGVLAGDTPVAEVARVLAERGVPAVAGRILAADRAGADPKAAAGGGCAVQWIAPPVTRPRVAAPKQPLAKPRDAVRDTATNAAPNAAPNAVPDAGRDGGTTTTRSGGRHGRR